MTNLTTREEIVMALADALMLADQSGIDFDDALAHAKRVYPPRVERDRRDMELTAIHNEGIVVLAMLGDGVDDLNDDDLVRAFNAAQQLRRISVDESLPITRRHHAQSLYDRIREAVTA